MDFKKIIAGAVSGFLVAVGVDFHAWTNSQSPDPKQPIVPFNWSLAVKRWIGGAIGGAIASLGVGQVTG